MTSRPLRLPLFSAFFPLLRASTSFGVVHRTSSLTVEVRIRLTRSTLGLSLIIHAPNTLSRTINLVATPQSHEHLILSKSASPTSRRHTDTIRVASVHPTAVPIECWVPFVQLIKGDTVRRCYVIAILLSRLHHVLIASGYYSWLRLSGRRHD
jgi:hypothetical protein